MKCQYNHKVFYIGGLTVDIFCVLQGLPNLAVTAVRDKVTEALHEGTS